MTDGRDGVRDAGDEEGVEGGAPVVDAAQEVIDNPRAMAIARVRANTVLGRLRARRGETGAREALAEARRLGCCWQ